MKKLFVIVLAAIGMVSCMNTDEVIEVKGGDAIAFADVMLDNAVRAAVDPSTTFETIQGFNVWGFMDDVKGVVFEGDEVKRQGETWTYSPTQYWAPSHTYYFAALSPIGGQWTLNTANGGTLGAGIVNFVNNDGSEDLLYAKAIVTTEADINKQPGAVKLQFQHLLSKVKFTFKSEFPSVRQTIKVKDIKMTAAKAGSIDLAVADYTKGWVLTDAQETYSFGDLENTLTINDADGWESAQERLLIPAGEDYVYTITFTVEIYNGQNLAQTFNETTELTGKALEMGTAYNFVATLSPANLGLYPIQFTVGVDSWVEEDVDVDYRTDIVYTADELAAALTSNGDVNVILGANIDLPIAKLGQQTGGSGEYKLGGDTTGEINIDLNGKTLNVTTTYWSALGAKNDNATITIKNGKMTSTGNSAGTWNAWDLRFSNCNYVFEDVEFGKAVALDNVGKSTVMNKVTITDTHNTDTYGLWITAEGQTVTLNDCVIDMTPATDGRGIKIDEQYVGAPAKVTLNIKNTTIKTEEKAAILVKSVAGAEINVNGIDIAGVAADNQFAVWVDSDAAAYANRVTVNGALCKVEGTTVAVYEVATAAELAEKLALAEAKTIVLAADKFEGAYKMTANTTLVGNGAEVGSIDLNGADNVTLVGIKFDAANAAQCVDRKKGTLRQWANVYSAGSKDVLSGSNYLVIDGCTFGGTFANGGAAIAFADQGRTNYDGQSGNITIKNCVFETEGAYYDIYTYYAGKGYMNIEGNTFKGATQGKNIYLGQYQSSTPVVVEGNTFEQRASFTEAAYVQSHSGYTASFAAANNTFGN